MNITYIGYEFSFNAKLHSKSLKEAIVVELANNL